MFYTWGLPRKLGQHFLTSESILAQIAAAAGQTHPECIVEIGPGRGALTRHLLPLCQQLHVIELDERLVQFLTRNFPDRPSLHIHHADALDADLAQWGPAVITGNLPYYITSPLVERFLKLTPEFPLAVFLMQLEVAERLLATFARLRLSHRGHTTGLRSRTGLQGGAFGVFSSAESGVGRITAQAPGAIDSRFGGPSEICGTLFHAQTQNAAQQSSPFLRCGC